MIIAWRRTAAVGVGVVSTRAKLRQCASCPTYSLRENIATVHSSAQHWCCWSRTNLQSNATWHFRATPEYVPEQCQTTSQNLYCSARLQFTGSIIWKTKGTVGGSLGDSLYHRLRATHDSGYLTSLSRCGFAIFVPSWNTLVRCDNKHSPNPVLNEVQN